MTTVYIAEQGVYAEQSISGVYGSAEAAMAANPVSDRERARWSNAGWKRSGDGEWHNGCDFGDCCYVTAYEVEAAPVHTGDSTT